jgi:hypothetical protein
MFHSIYSRSVYRGDGDGGYIVYKSGTDARINAIVAGCGMGRLDMVIALLMRRGLVVRLRTNAYHECLECAITKISPRWQDEQTIQIIGDSAPVLLLTAFAVWNTFFCDVIDWISEADHIDTQDLPSDGRQINFDASVFDEPSN